VNRLLPLVLGLLLAGCAGADRNVPSLDRRAAETIDPRLPVPDRSLDGALDVALAAQVAAIVDRARGSTSQFDAAIAAAERVAVSAGAPQSESWISAQQALSVAIAARASVSVAVGDLDALIEQQVRRGIRRVDLENATRAADDLSDLDRRQAARVDALQQRLGG
jgi:citrate lyase gamma subunit